MRIVSALFLACISAEQLVFSSEKFLPQRLLTAQDLVEMYRMGSVTVTPDASNILFTRWEYNISSDKTTQAIWMHKGQSQVALTRPVEGQKHSELVMLDSDNFAFVEDGSKLFLLQIGKEIPVQVIIGDIKYPIANLKYINGQFVFTAEIYPGKSLQETKVIDEHKKVNEKSSGKVYNNLYMRHWDTWEDGKISHVFAVNYNVQQTSKIDFDKAIDLMQETHMLNTPVKPFGDASNFDLTSKWLAFSSMAHIGDSKQAWSTETNIYLIDRTSDNTKPQVVSGQGKGAKNNPQFSPDKEQLAWLAMDTPTYEADRNQLFVCTNVESCESTTIPLSSNWDHSITQFKWAMDGQSIFVVAEEHGAALLWSIDVKSKDVKKLTKGGSVSSISTVTQKKDEIILTMSSMTQSPVVEKYNLIEQTVDRLFDINEHLFEKVRVGEPQKFWFTGAKDEKVMGWIIRAPGVPLDRKSPIAFYIHGGPQSSWLDSWSTRWNPQVMAAQGYTVVMINFHGSTGYGQDFTDSIRGNWGTHPYKDLMMGLDYVLETFPYVKTDEVYALGASYGGFMINWINGHTNRFQCLVNHDGLFDVKTMYYTTEELYFSEWEFKGVPWDGKSNSLYKKFNPSDFVGNWATPTMVIHGNQDFRVPVGEGIATFTALQRRGIKSKFLYFEDENHWVLKPSNSLKWHSEIFNWLKECTVQ